MKIENLSQELKEKVKQLLESAPADQKADAIMQSIEMIEEAAHADLINQVVAEAERASHDAEFKKQLGLRNLSQEEKKFYEGFKDIKQSVTANQIDIIPTEIIDRTLDDVRKASPILKLVNMAPANVKKWIVASHSGAAVWGDLTDEIKGELSGTISALNIELHMLSAYLVIPKAIRELSMEFVDRYFMAILSEAMQDGLVKGYLDGDGKTGPIGIFRQIGTTNDDGTNKAKTVLNNITKFSPKGLANVRKTLTNNGKRVVTKLYLICNPADEAEYVDPCMFGEALTGGYVNKTFIDIEKIPDANCPQGKAAFTIRMCGREALNTKNGEINEEYRLAIRLDTPAGKDGGKECIFSTFKWSNWTTCVSGTSLYIKNIKKPNNELYTAQELKELSIDFDVIYQLLEQQETDLTPEQTQALKELVTYYPVTNISVNSDQLDGYTVFNYPISMANGWNYVKQQLGDTRDYIYDMDAKAQDIDIQSAEAYVNSEYAVALTELEV